MVERSRSAGRIETLGKPVRGRAEWCRGSVAASNSHSLCPLRIPSTTKHSSDCPRSPRLAAGGGGIVRTVRLPGWPSAPSAAPCSKRYGDPRRTVRTMPPPPAAGEGDLGQSELCLRVVRGDPVMQASAISRPPPSAHHSARPRRACPGSRSAQLTLDRLDQGKEFRRVRIVDLNQLGAVTAAEEGALGRGDDHAT